MFFTPAQIKINRSITCITKAFVAYGNNVTCFAPICTVCYRKRPLWNSCNPSTPTHMIN